MSYGDFPIIRFEIEGMKRTVSAMLANETAKMDEMIKEAVEKGLSDEVVKEAVQRAVVSEIDNAIRSAVSLEVRKLSVIQDLAIAEVKKAIAGMKQEENDE